jgi:hypothetical protein
VPNHGELYLRNSSRACFWDKRKEGNRPLNREKDAGIDLRSLENLKKYLAMS